MKSEKVINVDRDKGPRESSDLKNVGTGNGQWLFRTN